MPHIYFIRHGQTEWNRIRRFQGQQDIPLNGLGRQQAQAAAEALKETSFDVLYSSDLSRAHETAQIVNAHHDLDICQDPRLRERSFGCFEGYTLEEAEANYPEERRAYEQDKLNYQIPGGESRRLFIGRIGPLLEELDRRHPDQTVAVVAHGGVLGAMVSYIISKKLGFDTPQFIPLFTIQNGSISQLKRRGDQWLILTLNETHHLHTLVDEGVGEFA